ncbi:hypothetical protein [Leptospira sp. GIMC2001]|uniref:hypothetical protein n=1 Tax=Leptospira sp. GIMC2001 TaxID=1513297 RepID=UPI00234A2126|nr:hypothetical protein [Leptospira sp. GIMC2001]WCL49179.1 hypothetical protein O4O04_18085 [Leptospira sp. GIMC2001]
MSIISESVSISPNELNAADIDSMFRLMDDSYFGVQKNIFITDLQSKDKILIIRKLDKIIGFTTFKFHEIDDLENPEQKLTVCFSGDTVIDPQFRGDLNLPIQWGIIMLRESLSRNTKIYWLLTTKGIRTYRYLPVFFYNFYPSPVLMDSKLENLCKHFGKRLFGFDFDDSRGILERKTNVQTIRKVEEDLAYINRKKDPFVKYFLTKNPNFSNGDELVCLAEFSMDNIKPFIKKILLNKNEQ